MTGQAKADLTGQEPRKSAGCVKLIEPEQQPVLMICSAYK